MNFSCIYQRWLSDEDRYRTINPEILSDELLSRAVITLIDKETVSREPNTNAKNNKLFLEIMPTKGKNGFDSLVFMLKNNNCEELAENLETLKREQEKSTSTPAAEDYSNICLSETRKYLADMLKTNYDVMHEYWTQLMYSSTLETFVELEILKEWRSERGQTVTSISQIFEKGKELPKRILIIGDPGCGKTTYVNKIALDWANRDGDGVYLNENFKLVFFIQLQTLDKSVEDFMKQFVQPELKENAAEAYLKNKNAKLLIILDGFDELSERSPHYQPVLEILKGREFQTQTVIMTTRRSHVDKIPIHARQHCLLVNGFTEQSMNQFLDKQRVTLPVPSNASNIRALLRNPLFCAIFSVVSRDEYVRLEDSFDFLKKLVDQSRDYTLANKDRDFAKATKRPRSDTKETEVEKQLAQMGKFAFTRLDEISAHIATLLCQRNTHASAAETDEKQKDLLNEICDLCQSSQLDNAVPIDLTGVKINLLIKRKVQILGQVNDQFKDEYSFPHQLIAEYLAARYLARCQVNQLNLRYLFENSEKRIMQGKYATHPSNSPFVRFFLSEIFFLALEGAVSELFASQLSEIPELRLIWRCKSTETILNMKTSKRFLCVDSVTQLNFNNFNAEVVNHIRFFEALSQCPKLSTLKLSNCPFSTQSLKLFAELITKKGRFMNLVDLDLCGVEKVQSTIEIGSALRKLRKLSVLNLSQCDMSFNLLKELFPVETDLFPSLTMLNLNGNSRVGEFDELFRSLSKYKSLSSLFLESCSLSPYQLETFASLVIKEQCFQALVNFDLQGNVNVGSATEISAAICKIGALSTLILSSCKLSITFLDQWFCVDNVNSFQSVTVLELAMNSNVGQSLQMFPSIAEYKSLSSLQLSGCELTTQQVEMFAELIITGKCFKQLVELNLDGNKNVGCVVLLVDALFELNHLSRLSLATCTLSEVFLQKFAKLINSGGLQNLTTLNVSGSKKVGLSAEFFAVLYKCQKLETLRIMECDIKNETLDVFLETFSVSTFQNLLFLDFNINRNMEIRDNFYCALTFCPNISTVVIMGTDNSCVPVSDAAIQAKKLLNDKTI